jgi:hypothetical protein
MSKTFGKARYIAFFQIPLTVGGALLGVKWFGMPGIILAITLPYLPGLIYSGVRYLGSITGCSAAPLLWEGVLRPAIATPVCCLAAWLCSFSIHCLPGYFGLMISASLGTLAAMTAMLALGISPQVRQQTFAFAKKILRRPVVEAGAKA